MYIYKIYHESSDKIYIGKTQRSLQKRLSGHLQDAKKSNSHIHRWLVKLRRNGFYPKIESVEKVYNSNWEQRERHWIKFYREKLGRDLVLNVRDGGEDPPQGLRLGKTISDESRIKMSIAQKKRFKNSPSQRKGAKFTPEQLKRMSESHLGQKAWNKGIPFSREVIERQAESRRNFKQEDVNNICELYWINNKKQKEISNIYNCNQQIISCVIHKKNGYKYTGNKDIKFCDSRKVRYDKEFCEKVNNKIGESNSTLIEYSRKNKLLFPALYYSFRKYGIITYRRK